MLTVQRLNLCMSSGVSDVPSRKKETPSLHFLWHDLEATLLKDPLKDIVATSRKLKMVTNQPTAQKI